MLDFVFFISPNVQGEHQHSADSHKYGIHHVTEIIL